MLDASDVNELVQSLDACVLNAWHQFGLAIGQVKEPGQHHPTSIQVARTLGEMHKAALWPCEDGVRRDGPAHLTSAVNNEDHCLNVQS